MMRACTRKMVWEILLKFKVYAALFADMWILLCLLNMEGASRLLTSGRGPESCSISRTWKARKASFVTHPNNLAQGLKVIFVSVGR